MILVLADILASKKHMAFPKQLAFFQTTKVTCRKHPLMLESFPSTKGNGMNFLHRSKAKQSLSSSLKYLEEIDRTDFQLSTNTSDKPQKTMHISQWKHIPA